MEHNLPPMCERGWAIVNVDGDEEEEEEEEDDDEHMTRMRGGCRRDDVTPRDQTSGNATWGKEITCARSRAIWFRDR